MTDLTNEQYLSDKHDLCALDITEQKRRFASKRMSVLLNFHLVDGDLLFQAEVCRIDSNGWRNGEYTQAYKSPYSAIKDGLALAESILNQDKYN